MIVLSCSLFRSVVVKLPVGRELGGWVSSGLLGTGTYMYLFGKSCLPFSSLGSHCLEVSRVECSLLM